MLGAQPHIPLSIIDSFPEPAAWEQRPRFPAPDVCSHHNHHHTVVPRVHLTRVFQLPRKVTINVVEQVLTSNNIILVR